MITATAITYMSETTVPDYIKFMLIYCFNGPTASLTSTEKTWQTISINQSINVKFVGRRYTTRPGAPTVVSGKHDKKVHS